MQNAGLTALGLDWRYVAFDVWPEQLREAISGAKAMGFVGLNLTVPHKLLAMELVDDLDESARSWGAVNTIRFEAQDATGAWQPVWRLGERPATVRARGFNTDAGAITRSIEEDLSLRLAGTSVLLLGAGGAGRTAALKLASAGVRSLHLVNRTVARAEAVAAEIRQRWPDVVVEVGYPAAVVDLLVNATSLGLKRDDPLPLDPAAFAVGRAGAVYDMIYRPAETPLLAAAKAAGCRVANGLGMLLYQGARALEIWSEQVAPVDEMRRALEESVYGAR